MTPRFTRALPAALLLVSAMLVSLLAAPSAAQPDAHDVDAPASSHPSLEPDLDVAGAPHALVAEDDDPQGHGHEGEMGPVPSSEARSSAASTAAAVGTGQHTPPQWWPLRGSNGIGCTYNSPGAYCNGHHSYHAIDIGGPKGQDVYASGGGIATVYDTNRGCTGYGVTVKVDHGPYGASIYAHLDSIAPAVTNAPGGLWVDENTVIGTMGHTGSVSNCNYAHLHYEQWSSGQWSSSRSPTSDLKACVGGQVRTYPDFFGQDQWAGLPGHSYTGVSEGTSCGGNPVGAVEAAAGSLGGFAQFRGWTLDPDALATSTEVHVYVDGPAGVGTNGTILTSDRPRPDVAWSFPGAGEPHGFHGAIGGLSPGAHTLYVYAINVSGTAGSNTLIGTPSLSVPTPTPGMPSGSFDEAEGLSWGQASVRGWAFDPDVPATSTQVQVFIDGPPTSGAPSVVIDANKDRPDVAAAFPGIGPLHGFDAVIDGIEPGTRMLWIYALNASGPSGNPLIGVRTVTVTGDPSGCAAGSTQGPFADVPPGHTFCRDIEWVAAEGIDPGYPNNTFAPSAANTRAMMAEQLYNLAGKPSFTAATSSPFSDVATTDPRYVAIAWLASTGITTGYGDGTFKPDATVSRQAMAAFFHRIAGAPAVDPAATFADVPANHTFSREIAWLATTGITTGYGDGTFQPTALITRQAMAAFLQRYGTL